MAVIVLHYFNAGIGGATKYMHGTYSVFVYHVAESVCFCAVDLFVMLSAFFLCETPKRKPEKIISLFTQAAILRAILYLINVFVFKSAEFSVGGLIGTLFIFGYFLVFYAIVYFLSPLVNNAFSGLDEIHYRKSVIAVFVLFTVLALLPDALTERSFLGQDWLGNSTVTNSGSFEGYTVVNFFLCYIVGAYIKKYHTGIERKRIILLLCINTVLLIIWSYLDWMTAYLYNNPLVVIEAALLILLFNSIHFESRIINCLAKSAFTCYLIHGFFLKFIDIPRFAGAAWYVMVTHLIISVIGIYFVCWGVYWVYENTFGKLVGIFFHEIRNG